MRFSDINEAIFARDAVVDHYAQFHELYPKEEEVLRRYYSSGTELKILDLGCGAGRLTKVLSDRGHDVVGMDKSKPLIEQALTLYSNIDFRIGDARILAFESASFDHVWFGYNGLDFVYPYVDRLRVLREMYRVLRPGGLAIYSSHNSLCVATTRRSRWRDIGINVANGRIFQRYRRIFSDVEGEAFIFYQHPVAQVRLLRSIGFSKVDIVSSYLETWRQILSDSWPYYVARK